MMEKRQLFCISLQVCQALVVYRHANKYSYNKSNQQNFTQNTKPGWKCDCGQVNNPNAMRCINCEKERSINHYWNCKSCGKQNYSTSNFCSTCGTQKPN